MKCPRVVVCLAGACAVVAALAAEPKLPVVSVSYDGRVGSTETDEEMLEDSSYRHEVGLRVREDWSPDVVSVLAGTLMRKSVVSGSGVGYCAAQISPELRWRMTEGLRWNTELGVRRAVYDEPYATGASRDYTRLRADTILSVELAGGLELAPRLQAIWELYDDPSRSRQSYGMGVSIDAKLGRWVLGADYRGTLRLPLGLLNVTTMTRLDHTFGANLSWDPNR